MLVVLVRATNLIAPSTVLGQPNRQPNGFMSALLSVRTLTLSCLVTVLVPILIRLAAKLYQEGLVNLDTVLQALHHLLRHDLPAIATKEHGFLDSRVDEVLA